jgi:hypothetical protein
MDIGMPGLGGMRASNNNAANKGMAFEEENHSSSALYPELAMSLQRKRFLDKGSAGNVALLCLSFYNYPTLRAISTTRWKRP